MADPQIPIPDGSLTVETIGQLQDWNEDKIRKHFRGQVDDMITDLIEKLKAGVFGRLSDIFRGVSPPGMGDFFDQIWLGLSGNLSDALTDTPNLDSRLTPIRDAARGLIAPVAARVDAVEESQLSTEEQLGLLDGVRGYGAVYQPYNYGGNVNSVSLSFTDPVGPMKGVSIEPAVKGLRIEEPGLWLVSVRATGRATAATNGIGQQDRTELTVREYPIGKQPRDVASMTGNGGNGRVTNTMTFPLVVEQAGTVITVDAYSSRWRRWEGGKLYSNLSVTKLDSRPENPGDWTVPDA